MKQKSWGGGDVSYYIRERRRQQFVTREMNARRKHAIGDWDKAARIFNRSYRYLIGNIDEMCPFHPPNELNIKRRIGIIMQSEVEFVWEEGCMKMKEKVNHLDRKWNKRYIREPSPLPGIAITDQELNDFIKSTD